MREPPLVSCGRLAYEVLNHKLARVWCQSKVVSTQLISDVKSGGVQLNALSIDSDRARSISWTSVVTEFNFIWR